MQQKFFLIKVTVLILTHSVSSVGIKKKSKVPGVMITQFIEEIPEGKSHPDFTRKPIALTIQEGMLLLSFSTKVLFTHTKCLNNNIYQLINHSNCISAIYIFL